MSSKRALTVPRRSRRQKLQPYEAKASRVFRIQALHKMIQYYLTIDERAKFVQSQRETSLLLTMLYLPALAKAELEAIPPILGKQTRLEFNLHAPHKDETYSKCFTFLTKLAHCPNVKTICIQGAFWLENDASWLPLLSQDTLRLFRGFLFVLVHHDKQLEYAEVDEKGNVVIPVFWHTFRKDNLLTLRERITKILCWLP
jgi:hypothetical protein